MMEKRGRRNLERRRKWLTELREKHAKENQEMPTSPQSPIYNHTH